MDAGIVLIDLHQLNVKTTSDNPQISDTEYGQLSCQRRTEPAEQQPATSAFLTKWLNKLTSLLSKKGPGISQPGSLKPAVGETNVRKEHIHQLKVMKNEISCVLPSEQDDIVNSLNYEGIAVIGVAVLPLSWQWQTACWLCHRLNSLND